MTRSVLCLLGAFLITACTALPGPRERRDFADALAAKRGWVADHIATDTFDFVAYAPQRFIPDETLTVYLEGDGFAWVTSTQPSLDPTPRDPLGLRLALAHARGNAAYLARPCQFTDAHRRGCDQRYWTARRFAPEVIRESSKAIDELLQRFGATKLALVGYSGGGAVAALLAARRTDVVRLVTVAGNLDHRAWARHHGIHELHGSLNPADEAAQLGSLSQTHYVGGRDPVIPPALARDWPAGLVGAAGANLRVMPDFDHHCCWAERWEALNRQGH